MVNIVNELKAIKRFIRRKYYLIFRMEYVYNQVMKRKGSCGQHGCCDMTLGGKIFSIRCLHKNEKNICTKWNKLPRNCFLFPFDEKDKEGVKDICNFYWDN